MNKLKEKSVFLLPLLIVFIVCLNLYLTWDNIEDNAVDNFIVDIAGRQRMLSQKILSEFILDKMNIKNELRDSINLFVEHSVALEKGGYVRWTFDPNDNMFIPAAPTKKIAGLLDKQREIFAEFVEAGYKLHKLGPALDSNKGSVENTLALSIKVNQKSDEIVKEFDKYYQKALEGSIRTRVILSSLIILMGLSLIYILYRKDLLARQLHLAKLSALDAIQAKTNFFANISHEIRNPLNVIVSIPELLETSSLSADQHKYVKILDNTSRHLLTLISDLLDFSKIEAGNTHLNITSFDLKTFVEGLVDYHSFKAKEKNIQIQLNWDANLNPKVRGDSNRLRQVLDNLIGNALKFTDAGKIEVSIKKASSELGLQYISFCVLDTGIGISEADKNKVFDTYVQVGSNSLNKRGGSGLGLAIAKQLVNIMAGTISVKSQISKGSEFSFTIPLEISLEEENHTKKLPPTLKVPDLPRNKLSVLIVDDSIDNLYVLHAILEKTMGYEVTSAESGAAALEMFKNHKFDLVLMDIQMPEMSGSEVAIAMRKWEKTHQLTHTPLIAFTASVLSSTPPEFDDFALKPIDKNQLLRTMSECLGSKIKMAGFSTTSPTIHRSALGNNTDGPSI